MPTINGIPVNFGFTSTANGMTVTGLAGLLLQSAEQTAEADNETCKNGAGDVVMSGWTDQRRMFTLEAVFTHTTNIAGAITATTLTGLTPGTIIAITACASSPDLVYSYWEVQSGAKISQGNTTYSKVSIPIVKRSGVTAVAS